MKNRGKVKVTKAMNVPTISANLLGSGSGELADWSLEFIKKDVCKLSC